MVYCKTWPARAAEHRPYFIVSHALLQSDKTYLLQCNELKIRSPIPFLVMGSASEDAGESYMTAERKLPQGTSGHAAESLVEPQVVRVVAMSEEVVHPRERLLI